MTNQQAIEILAKVTATLNLSRQDHATIIDALTVLTQHTAQTAATNGTTAVITPKVVGRRGRPKRLVATTSAQV